MEEVLTNLYLGGVCPPVVLYADIVALVYLLYEGDQEWVTDELKGRWISNLERLLNRVSGGDDEYREQKNKVLESAKSADFFRYLSPRTPGEYTREDEHFLVKLEKMILGDDLPNNMGELVKTRLPLVAGVKVPNSVGTHVDIHFSPQNGMDIS
jgi:hypothetical protein